MATEINCHFLPQVYMRSFCIEDRQGFLYAAKRMEFGWSKFFQPIHITKVCSIKNLFVDFSFTKKEKREYLEMVFDKTVENGFQKIIKKIKSHPFLVVEKSNFTRQDVFSSEESSNLIKFLSLQILRSPKWFHMIWADAKNPDSKLKKSIKKLKMGLGKEGKDAVERGLAHGGFLALVKSSLNGERVHEKFIEESDWVLEINLTGVPFITSDDPVINFDEGYGCLFCPLTKIYGIRIPIGNQKKRRLFVEFCDVNMVNAWNYFQVKRAYANNYHFSTVIGDDKELIKGYIDKTKTDPHIIKDPSVS